MHLQTIMHRFRKIHLHVYACTHVKNNSLTCCLRMHAHIARPRIMYLLLLQRKRAKNKTRNFGIPKMCHKNHLGNQLSISKLF